MSLRPAQSARPAVVVLATCLVLALGGCSSGEGVGEPAQQGAGTTADASVT